MLRGVIGVLWIWAVMVPQRAVQSQTGQVWDLAQPGPEAWLTDVAGVGQWLGGVMTNRDGVHFMTRERLVTLSLGEAEVPRRKHPLPANSRGVVLFGQTALVGAGGSLIRLTLPAAPPVVPGGTGTFHRAGLRMSVMPRLDPSTVLYDSPRGFAVVPWTGVDAPEALEPEDPGVWDRGRYEGIELRGRGKRRYKPSMPQIRRATRADAAALAQIEAESWHEAYRGLLKPSVLARLDPTSRVDVWRARARSDARELWVIAVGGQVAGYASVGPAQHRDLEAGFAGEVYELYLHPDHQGRGLGRSLLAACWTRLAEGGFYWGVLEVLRDNHRARGFYEATGMQTDGRPRRRASGARRGGGRVFSQGRSSVVVVRYETPLHRWP